MLSAYQIFVFSDSRGRLSLQIKCKLPDEKTPLGWAGISPTAVTHTGRRFAAIEFLGGKPPRGKMRHRTSNAKDQRHLAGLVSAKRAATKEKPPRLGYGNFACGEYSRARRLRASSTRSSRRMRSLASLRQQVAVFDRQAKLLLCAKRRATNVHAQLFKLCMDEFPYGSP